MNGVILLAYIVAIPANEIVIPAALTSGLAGAGARMMFELDTLEATGQILRSGGWTLRTAVNLMLVSLLPNPCSTTLYTSHRATERAQRTTLATLLPVGMGATVCFLVTQIWRLLA